MDIVRSAPAVLDRNPRVLFLIVGEGASRKEMEIRSRQLGVSGRFRFTGRVDYSLMPKYVNAADLVLMPSESEGLSRAYLECQACAKTLVASDIPATREVVTHGETGLLFRKGDIDDMVDKLLFAASRPDLRARIGELGLARVRMHSLDRILDEYVSLLQDLLGGIRSAQQ